MVSSVSLAHLDLGELNHCEVQGVHHLLSSMRSLAVQDEGKDIPLELPRSEIPSYM